MLHKSYRVVDFSGDGLLCRDGRFVGGSRAVESVLFLFCVGRPLLLGGTMGWKLTSMFGAEGPIFADEGSLVCSSPQSSTYIVSGCLGRASLVLTMDGNNHHLFKRQSLFPETAHLLFQLLFKFWVRPMSSW